MLAPATGFYGTPGLGKNEVRLAYVLNLKDLGEAMDCLEKALEEYPGRTVEKQMETAAATVRTDG
jgi:aspartate aminotransferase